MLSSSYAKDPDMAAATDREEEPLNQLFSDLNYNTVDAVVVNMTVESSRRRGDWRALAGILGFTEKQVQLMQQLVSEPCKGRLLVRVWEDLGRGSLRKFIFALKEANMGECLKVIMQDPDLEGTVIAVFSIYVLMEAQVFLKC